MLVNTPKGSDRFSRLDMDTLSSTLQVAHQYNGGFNEHTKAHPKRARFFSLISQGRTVEQAVASCLYVPLYRRMIRMAKRIVRAVLGDKGMRAVKYMVKKQ